MPQASAPSASNSGTTNAATPQPTSTERPSTNETLSVENDQAYGELVRQVAEKVLKLLKEDLRRDLERRGGK